jgi:monoamine oxidase
MKTEVAIVGGGLAGLALADRLHQSGVDFRLFEARAHLGGRIASFDSGAGSVDLGPSWFWPGQPRIAQLIEDLGLCAFRQHALGEPSFEDARGVVHRGIGFASMEGSFRVAGGMIALIDGLAERLPADRLNLTCPAHGIEREGRVLLAGGGVCEARHVVVALPPRVAARLRFEPALPLAVTRCLEAIPTWMAGHAKFVAVYERPFWRDADLSGDAISRRGPLVEIHDASGPDGSPAALFGFLGVAAAQRAGRTHEIEAAAREQLARIFGAEAMTPVASVIKDWAFDPETATDRDHAPPDGHPAYGLPRLLDGLCDGRLQFASTETASEMGGLMEGALATAERAATLTSGAMTLQPLR